MRADGQVPFRLGLFTAKDGLANNTLFCLFQDSRGLLWQGTEHGVSSYDGISFTTFSKQPYSNLRIGSIGEFADGSMGLVTREGMYVIDAMTGEVLRHEERISLLQSFPDGSRYYVRSDSLFDASQEERYMGLKMDNPLQVEKYSGGLYVFNSEKLWRIEEGKIEQLFHTSGILCVTEDGEGQIWIGTERAGLFVLKDGEVVRNFRTDNSSILHNDVRCVLAVDSSVWVGLNGGGFAVLGSDFGSWQNYPFRPDNAYGLEATTIMTFLHDREGIVWLGTHSDGLQYYGGDIHRFEWIRHIQGDSSSLISNSVRCFAQGDQGQVAIGTRYGVSISKGDGFANYVIEKDAQNTVLSLHFLNEDSLLVGTFNAGLKLLHIPTGLVEEIVLDYNKLGSHIYHIVRHKDGRFYIGTTKSLFGFDFRSQEVELLEEHLEVKGLKVEGDSLMYSSSKGFGIHLLQEKQSWSFPRSSLGVFVRVGERLILQDLRGGLLAYDLGKSTFTKSINTLSSGEVFPHIHSMELVDGMLYLGTSRGIELIDLGVGYNPTLLFSNKQLVPNSSLLMEEGALYFGTSNGAVRFDPRDRKHHTTGKPIPLIVFSKALIGNGFEQGDDVQVLLKGVTLVRHDKPTLTYRISGYTDEWQEAANSSSVDLSRLPVGDYVLELVIGEQRLAEPFRVRVPFWYYYLGISVVVLVGLVVLLMRRRRKEEEGVLNYGQVTDILKEAYRSEDMESRLVSMILEEVSNPDLSVDYLAQKIGMSRTSLYRKVKEQRVKPVNDLIRETRLTLAAELLHKTDMSVSDVAYKTGFSTPSYFSKSFSQKFGKSPLAFRKG